MQKSFSYYKDSKNLINIAYAKNLNKQNFNSILNVPIDANVNINNLAENVELTDFTFVHADKLVLATGTDAATAGYTYLFKNTAGVPILGILKDTEDWKFERIENLPLVIGVNENVVRVYYVTDDVQTKELSYIVEYNDRNILSYQLVNNEHEPPMVVDYVSDNSYFTCVSSKTRWSLSFCAIKSM